MKYIQALKEQGYNLKALPNDIKKGINLVLKSKDYNSKIEALDFITFNSIRNSQPSDERIEELYKLSLTDHSVENNNGFNTPLSIEIVTEEFGDGGHIATKDDNNKVRNWKVRFHLGRGENYLHWKIENPKTKEVEFYNPDEVQIEMYNCKLTNSPATAMKIFTGKSDKSPIAWVVCEKYKVSKKIDPVDSDERLTYNPRTAPNWFDTDGDNVDNFVFEKLITFGRGVYYEAPDGKLFALGGISDSEPSLFATGGNVSPSRMKVPNVRGGWTKEKIIKYFKEQSSDTISTPTLAKYISAFENWQQFKEHIYYHGTTNSIERGLMPSMAFSERWAEQQGGGGYGERYFGVSLTKRKRTAEIFSAGRSGVDIYPVILKKDAKVIYRTDLEDASEVESIIVDLYEQGIDAVWIDGGEEELVVVNPYAILLYKSGREYHTAFGGFKSVPLTDQKIKEIYDASLNIWEDYSKEKSKTTSKSERDELLNSISPIQFETGGQTKQTGKDLYENNIMQIRIIGGDANYYKRVNQEWKFLSPEEVENLKVGTKHELEHFSTLEAFKRRDIPNEIIASFIAYDHLNEDLNYYQKLDKAIPEKMSTGKKIEHFPEVVLEIYANNEYYRKANFTENALIDVVNQKIKFTQLDTGSGNFRIAWKKVYENSNGYYIDYDYFGGRIFIENWFSLCQENAPQKMAEGSKLSENKEEQIMEKETPTGSVSNWNEVPVRWKNVKSVRPITFSLNPYDKGLNIIIKEFLGDDALRPVMTAMNFSDSGVVSTDAHKLLHIHYKHSDFRGNYATANTMKALKGGRWSSQKTPVDLEDATTQIKDDKYPNWIAVIPKDNPHVYEVDIMKLYQYLNVAINYANKTTNQVAFRYDNGRVIGFNGKYFMQCLEAMMKMQKCTKVYLHLSEPTRGMLISYEKSITPTGNTFALQMPVMVNRGELSQILGASDPDFGKSLSCYFDFEDSKIHNGDGSIAEYKESYGDAMEMPLALITMLDKFIKTAKSRVVVLENVCVDGNGIRVDSIDARIEIANDWNIPQGLYRIEKNAMVKNTLGASLEDYPQLKARVSTKDPVFVMDANVFKFYIQKAFEHTGDDDLRPMLKCISFEYSQGGNLQIISTDAHSLFHVNITKYASQIKNENFAYPLDFSKQLMNFTKNIDAKEVKFYVDEDKNYRIDGGRLHFEARLGDGKYPNWEAIVPKGYSNQLMFDIKDLYVCMNNEVAKQFIKKEDLKIQYLSVYNQDQKIFISNLPKNNYQTEKHITEEICELKIKKETFQIEKSFNATSQNYVLLMPTTWTNGNYFNFAVEPLNDVFASIGKEKVIVNYSELNRSYIFTSDNLDYKTSDVYKPEKEVVKTIEKPTIKKKAPLMVKPKATGTEQRNKFIEPTDAQRKMALKEVPAISEEIKNEILFFENKFGIINKEKKSQNFWDARYVHMRRKLFPDYVQAEKTFGFPLSKFKVGDIVGGIGRNSDSSRYAILELTNDKAFLLPYNFASPTIYTFLPNQSHWELIEPKQSLLTTAQQKKEFNEFMFGKDFMKSKDKGALKEYKEPMPASTHLKNPSEFNVGDLIEYAGVLYEVKTPKTKDNFSLLINKSDTYRKGDIQEFANTEHTKVFKLVTKKSANLSKVSVSKPVANVVSDSKDLEKAIKGLEAFLFSFGATKTKANLKESLAVQSAIKGLKALLK